MNINSNKAIIQVTTFLATILFVVSLTQKSYCHDNECGDAIMCLLIGWIGVLYEFFDLITGLFNLIIGKGFTTNPKIGATASWLANPFIVLSLVTLGKNSTTALKLSTVSTLLILSFLFFESDLHAEAGQYLKITSYGTGYWLWLCSSLSLLTGCLGLLTRKVK